VLKHRQAKAEYPLYRVSGFRANQLLLLGQMCLEVGEMTEQQLLLVCVVGVER
jgi:hypothetical protein